jgi:predicted GNAT family acetyltransferase
MDVQCVELGRTLPVETLNQLRELFAESYHGYHYTSSLGRPDRARFLVTSRNRVVGYAAYRPVGVFAVLSNLLVAAPLRGRGIGAELETARSRHALTNGLSLYVSCVCEDIASQVLKLRQNLVPAAVRFGYRREVQGPGTWGSSVVFAGKVGMPQPVLRSRRSIDVARSRKRYFGYPGEKVLELPDDGHYVDVLVGPDQRDRAMANTRLSYAGFDLDVATGSWHHCFQLRNRAFVEGLLAHPEIIAAPAEVPIAYGAMARCLT